MKFIAPIFIFISVISNLFGQKLETFDHFFKDKVLTRDSEHFKASWANPKDALIVPALLDHLEKAYSDLYPIFGNSSGASAKIPVEIFPDLRSFSEVSRLPLARFKATGTIALTLDQRLMILSPRNLAAGYPWATTVVHEFTHYLIREISMEYIPIWLHEGVAQLYQGYPYEKKAKLSPSQWGLFRKYRQKNGLLSLTTLKEPFPYRKDPEEAELAYIEALLFSNWLEEKCGAVSLIRSAEALKNIDKALEKCTNMSLGVLEKKFIPEILGKVEIPKTKEVDFYARDFSSQDAFDKEGEKIDRQARDYAQLSHELFKQGRFKPATKEMEEAFKLTPVRPPSWSRHLALSYDKSGAQEKASNILKDLVEGYPDDAAAWYLLALQKQKSGSPQDVWKALMRAFFVNPFLDGLNDEIEIIKNKNPNFAYSLLGSEGQK